MLACNFNVAVKVDPDLYEREDQPTTRFFCHVTALKDHERQ